MLRGAVAPELGEAALVPELHGESDDGAALLLQEGGDGGRVDTAGHGDGNEAALCFGALRQRVELGCGNHSYFIISGNLSVYLRGGARGAARHGRRHYKGFEKRHALASRVSLGLLAIGGREFAELGDGGGDNVKCEIDVSRSGVAAEAEAQAGASFFRRQTDGGEHVGWFNGAGGTGGSRGTRETFQIESNEEGFALDARENKICSVRRARSRGGVHTRLRNAEQETLLQAIAEKRYALGVFDERLARDFGCFAEAHNSGDVFRAGTEAALVMSAVEKLAQTGSATNVQSADALGRIQCMSGNREQIHAERVDVDGNFTCGLHSVGVEINVGFLGDAADFLEWLDGAELVVGVHDGDENGFGPDGSAKVAEINLTVGASCKVSEANAALFERLASVEDSFMFDGAGNDMLFMATRSFNDPEDGVIVGFGGAAGEDDFLGAGADQSGDLFTGGFDGGASALAGSVDRSGVGKIRREIGQHSVEHFGLDRRGGVEIEVDAVHKSTHRILPAGEIVRSGGWKLERDHAPPHPTVFVKDCGVKVWGVGVGKKIEG